MDTLPYSAAGEKIIAKILLVWFAENQRPLPWRRDYLPYHVWIAEVMGQQTQMERVVHYFNRWIALFPDIASVAAAPEQEILKAWEGLGYYSRARSLHQTAKILMEQFDGVVPREEKMLLALPGIGPYTAAAILSIAFNRPCPLLDANVERLFARLYDIDRPVKQTAVRAELEALAKRLLPKEDGRHFNQALMEFGALVCTPRAPSCNSCPLGDHCRAHVKGTVAQRPVPGARKKTVEITMACGIIVHSGRVYIQQRMADDVWGSLWEFPGGRLKSGETPEQAACREVAEETEFRVSRLRPYATVVHHYTKYRVTLHGFTCRLHGSDRPVLHAAQQYRWLPLSRLADFPFPAGHRQLVARLVRATL